MPSFLFWNNEYLMLPTALDECPGECRMIYDRQRIAEANAVVFHLPTLRDPIEQLWKRPGQRWVAWSMESDVNVPSLADPEFMRQFDLTMTYRRDADVWVPYLEAGFQGFDGFVGPGPDAMLHPPHEKTETALAVYVASNSSTRSKREEYAHGLMQHLKVDSYGSSLNNRSWPADTGRATKLETLSRYRFTLAFENSIAEDYVTEKFFDAIVAGSVPVYLGAPNIADFAPGEHSYIDVNDFAGPRELATYLLELANDEDAYQEYLAWKDVGLRPEFVTLLDRLTPHPLCRLARLVAAA